MAVAAVADTSCGALVEEVDAAGRVLAAVLAHAPASSVSGPDAARLAEAFSRVERVAAAGKALYAHRVSSEHAFVGLGHKDAAGWLAKVSGDSVGRAKEALSSAEVAHQVPALRRALEAGELSGPGAALIARAAAVDPSCADELVQVGKDRSFSELRLEAARAHERARGENDARAEEARVHERRYCRAYSPREGGLRLEAWLSKLDGARVLGALDQAVADQGLADGETLSFEARRADALVALLNGPGPNHPGEAPEASGTCGGPGARVIVRVDAGALGRGHLGPGEICEIAGVGPVPVATARALLGDALLNVVVTRGVDVACVTGTGRTVPSALKVALAERDPVCVVPGCGVAHHLEIDHWRTDYARGGPTRLDNLARLCGPHHKMKTNLGWRLTGGPGNWGWVGPDDSRPPPGSRRARRSPGPAP